MVQLSTDISQTEFFFLSHSFCCDILKWAFFCYSQQQRVMKGRRSSVGRVPRHGTDVGLNPWSGKGFFSQSQLSVQTLLVSVKRPPPPPPPPPRAFAYLNMCVHIKNPQCWQPYHCLDAGKLQTLVGMGSAALTAAVPYPGKGTGISSKEQ